MPGATSGSWAHLVALLVAAGIAVMAIGTHRWWADYHSPPPPEDDDTGVTPGETWVSDDDDTTGDTLPEGRYRLADGSILVRQWQPPTPTDDGDVDLDLDDDGGETRAEMADRLVVEGGGYADMVRELMGAFDVSEATAKRDVAAARGRVG